jgi:hypothetical protein
MGIDIFEKGFIFNIGMRKNALDCGEMISYLIVCKENTNG